MNVELNEHPNHYTIHFSFPRGKHATEEYVCSLAKRESLTELAVELHQESQKLFEQVHRLLERRIGANSE